MLWWKRFPERLQYELEGLAAAGIEYRQDETAKSQGVMRLDLVVPVEGERVPLIAIFPDLYPFFRFEVQAPTVSLGHHQNPFVKNLCLIGRATHYWETDDTLASLLTMQLARALRTGKATDKGTVEGSEQRQAEPFSEYYPYVPGSIVMVGDWTIPHEHDRGTFTVAAFDVRGRPPLVRGVLAEVKAVDGQVLAAADPAVLAAFPATRIRGSWLRLTQPIRRGDVRSFLEELWAEFPHTRAACVSPVHGGWLQMWGVVFPEEVGWREDGNGWVFACRFDSVRSRLIHNAQSGQAHGTRHGGRRRRK